MSDLLWVRAVKSVNVMESTKGDSKVLCAVINMYCTCMYTNARTVTPVCITVTLGHAM